jgi:hypothetical protein
MIRTTTTSASATCPRASGTPAPRMRGALVLVLALVALLFGLPPDALAQDAAPPDCPPPAAAPDTQRIVSATRDAKDRGYLWRIRRDGRTSYLALFNFSGKSVTRAINLSRAGLAPGRTYAVTDLWSGAASTAQGMLSVSLDRDQAKLFQLD